MNQVKVREQLFKLDLGIEWNYVDLDEVEDVDSLRVAVAEANGFEVEEFSDYTDAIDYLLLHDPSFYIGVSLAKELNYKVDEICSIGLAGLVASKLVQDRFDDLEEEIDLIIKFGGYSREELNEKLRLSIYNNSTRIEEIITDLSNKDLIKYLK